MRQCGECKEYKDETEFYESNKRRCKVCLRIEDGNRKHLERRSSRDLDPDMIARFGKCPTTVISKS